MLVVDPHPLLELGAFVARFDRPLGEIASGPEVAAALAREFAAPIESSDAVRGAVRDLLRAGGFKPTGRSKPASEYLLAAAAAGLRSINLAVDVGNAISLHSGLPVSVVDLARVEGSFRVGVAAEGASYEFNAAGQVIDVGRLLCLSDRLGPCANAVKDAQRTKTDGGTRAVLVLIWGTRALEGRAAAVSRWGQDLFANHPEITVEFERVDQTDASSC